MKTIAHILRRNTIPNFLNGQGSNFVGELNGQTCLSSGKPHFHSIFSDIVVKTVGVQVHAIQFTFKEADIRTFEMRVSL